jgi:signal transduction histidine kinase
VTGLLAIVCITGLALFAHEINEVITTTQRSASTFSDRSASRHTPFAQAAVDFENRVRRDGFHTIAVERPPGPPGPPPHGVPPPGSRFHFGGSGPRPNEIAYNDGVAQRGVGVRGRFENSNRFGFAVETIFGVRVPPPQPFLDGVMAFTPDSNLFANVVLLMFATILVAGLVVGLFAAAVGRYITSQAIQPLIDVTEALQRFAARDFRAQPIVVAGRSEFDVLAHAYNAASAQVEAAFAERELADAQMRQFVADAGHELRTPLTIVLGYIDLLRRRVSANDERSRFIFNSIGSEGHRMRTLVDNLVLLAKLEGHDTRPSEPFDIGSLIAEVVDVRRELNRGRRFDLDLRVDAMTVGDRAEIHEALANIIDNAIKYAPGSPIAIELRDAGGGAIELAICDQGPGIPSEDRASIFERFYRGASRGEVEGSGLGLAIAKRAIDRAGGTLRLDESVATGTRFVIRLRAENIRARQTASV